MHTFRVEIQTVSHFFQTSSSNRPMHRKGTVDGTLGSLEGLSCDILNILFLGSISDLPGEDVTSPHKYCKRRMSSIDYLPIGK